MVELERHWLTWLGVRWKGRNVAELKPCPFCDKNLARRAAGAGEFWVVCWGCRASSAAKSSRVEGDAAWNTRAGDAELERLQEALGNARAAWDTMRGFDLDDPANHNSTVPFVQAERDLGRALAAQEGESWPKLNK